MFRRRATIYVPRVWLKLMIGRAERNREKKAIAFFKTIDEPYLPAIREKLEQNDLEGAREL